MMPMRSSLCRLSVSLSPLRMQPARRFHIDTARLGQQDTAGVLSDMISSGIHSSTERITRFMNSVYVNCPRSVSLFSFNYRQRTERSTIRGICIGTHGRKTKTAQKSVVVVSGLPLQDPSLIGVGLYVAAVLSRMPALPHDVSVIPLAHPKEYEHRWRSPHLGELRAFDSTSVLPEDASHWLAHENVTLELKDSCKPIEAYITRQNKYFINAEVQLLPSSSGQMQYKANSLAGLAAKGKHRSFLSDHSDISVPLPSSLSRPSSRTLIPEPADPLIAPLLAAPSLVLELKGTQPLDDEQVVARGEEVIRMVKQLLEA